MGMTTRQAERETTERRNVTVAPLAVPVTMQAGATLPFYMGEDELFRDPFTDGFPSRR